MGPPWGVFCQITLTSCWYSSCFSGNGNGRESGLLFLNKLELEYSLRFPKAGNGNGNKVVGMGGNGYTKVIPAHLCCLRTLFITDNVKEHRGISVSRFSTDDIIRHYLIPRISLHHERNVRNVSKKTNVNDGRVPGGISEQFPVTRYSSARKLIWVRRPVACSPSTYVRFNAVIKAHTELLTVTLRIINQRPPVRVHWPSDLPSEAILRSGKGHFRIQNYAPVPGFRNLGRYPKNTGLGKPT